MAAAEHQTINGLAQEVHEHETTEAEEDAESEKGNTAKEAITALRKKFVPGIKYSLLFVIAINFAMLVVGCINVHKCPKNPHIPFFLIVTGAIGVFVKFLSYIKDRVIRRINLKYLESALYFVELVFFFTGTYWTYGAFKPVFEDPHSRLYCNKTAYMFAFVYLTFFYTLLIGALVFACCFIVCFCALANASTETDPESQIPYIDETPSADERRMQRDEANAKTHSATAAV